MKNANIKELLNSAFFQVITWDEERDNVLTVNSENLLEIMEFLKDNTYEFLADITAVDYKDKFAVVYQLYQYLNNGHLTVRVELNHDNPQVESLCGIWQGANWLEREVLDLMGITFLNHPNPKRIMMWEGYDGHPLRKDYVHKPSKYQGRRSLRK